MSNENRWAFQRSDHIDPHRPIDAIKSSFVLGFLESVPSVAAKLKDPASKECKFEDVVKVAEKAAVLVLVY